MSNLIIDTLQKNKNVFNPNPENQTEQYGIWDLTRSSLLFNTPPSIESFFVVSDNYEMRPDLIAAIVYGDQGKVGSLLKFNSISNPFALEKNRYLIVPADESVTNSVSAKKIAIQNSPSSNTNTNPNEVFKKNQEQKKFKVSEGRKKFLQSKIKNQPNAILPPNVLQPEEKTIEKRNGFIVFAPNAGGGGFNKPQG
jgi:hypothetical protein